MSTKPTKYLTIHNAGLKAKAMDNDEDEQNDPGWIEGYLAVFGNIDQQGDIIVKGAFAKSISERVPARKVPLMCRHMAYGGDAMEVIGTITEAKEDDHGLWIHAELSGAEAAQEIRQKIIEGHVKGLSVGYQIIRYETQQQGDKTVYKLLECKLMEGTVTVNPANEYAQITGAKTTADIGQLIFELSERVKALEAKSTTETIAQAEPASDTSDAGVTEQTLALNRSFLEVEKNHVEDFEANR